MISNPDRREAVTLIDEAVETGARLFRACAELGLCQRTYRRWTAQEGTVKADGRPEAARPTPTNALSEKERQKLVTLSCQPEFASLPPSQIVPILADRGEYYASESSFYRVLKAHDLQHHRGRAAAPSPSEPKRHWATGPNQVWVWDITWLPGAVLGTYFYLYLMLDLFSRKVVGWEVHEEENAEHASWVIRKASLAEGRGLAPLVLHSDNGSPMKGATMLATLQKLGIAPSFSRPGVSDDNAHAEAFFRTLTYRPGYPSKGFKNLDEARDWSMKFVLWYNTRHQHSALKFVTPNQRHQGDDVAVLNARKTLYETAKAAKPERWSRSTRNWDRPDTVWLNPVRQEAKTVKVAA
jgi:transposase InsO family protein